MKNQPVQGQPFFDKIAQLILSTRQKVAAAVNLTMVHAYFEMGKMIVEHEQQGSRKAEYGKRATLRRPQSPSVGFLL
ncbi:MAG: DUF1016 N-terminal domain-containing protein [Saprospiraceae bacterium]